MKTNNKNKSEKEIKEHYKYFMENIPKHMEIAKLWLGKDKLDYSFEKMDAIEKNYIRNYKKNKKIGNWYEEMYEVYVTYFGETFIKYFLGEWELNLEKDTYNYGFPIIVNHGPKDGYWVAVDPSDTFYAIEENILDETLGEYFTRRIKRYERQPELNFHPLENLKNSLENTNY